MSGHSKWNTIKRKKAVTDAAKGKVFTRLAREIITAARAGGGDPEMNVRLRSAVSAARAANMPGANIEKAIKRGTGEIEGITYEEISFEGYGPGGVALFIEVVTDNRNRTVAEIRHLFSKNGGNMGESGSVGWMFDKKGYIVVDKAAKSEEELFEIAVGAGADDMQDDGDVFEIFTAPENFEAVTDAIKSAGIEPQAAEISQIPQNYIKLEGAVAKTMLKLYDALDDNDDVQKVWANFDIDESEMG